MFTRSTNLITSDEGFSVRVLGRVGLEYREGDRSAFVDSEVLVVGIMVRSGSLSHWDAPYESETITGGRKEKIINNICRAFAFAGEPVVLR